MQRSDKGGKTPLPAPPPEPATEAGRVSKIEVQRNELHVERSYFQGPFPPPEAIAAYEAHCPGFLRELLEMSKSAQSHEEYMDRQSIDVPRRYLERGQYLGFAITVIAMSSATYCAAIGQWQVGVALGLSALAPLVGHFLKNPFTAGPSRPEAAEPTGRKADRGRAK